MRTMLRTGLAIVLAIVLVGGALGSAAKAGGAWVCPPCGHACDQAVYPEPGRCPVCGMQLVAAGPAAATPRVVILLFEGVQIIDFAGPYEVFGQARFEVRTASRDGQPVTTAMGLRVTPDHSFANSPAADILVVPGGHVEASYGDEATVAWLQRQAGTADQVLTVCNGAFILARTGLLDGLAATTFYRQLDALESFAPRVRVVRDQRFVDNGRIVTSAGLSSGVDGALHVVEKLLGRGRAQQIALHLEYQWDPESKFARAALADLVLPELTPPPGTEARIVATAGDRDRWESRFVVVGTMSAAEIDQHLERQLSAHGWQRDAEPNQAGRWRFQDRGGRPWRAETVVTSGTPGETAVHVRLERVADRRP